MHLIKVCLAIAIHNLKWLKNYGIVTIKSHIISVLGPADWRHINFSFKKLLTEVGLLIVIQTTVVVQYWFNVYNTGPSL